MAEITLSEALPVFTNEIVAKYSDHQKPKSFGRSFFQEVSTATKLASILSERGINLIASDVPRGSRGNLNTFDRLDQKIVLPPYFNEYFNLLELQSYDNLFVNGTENSTVAWGQFIDDIAGRMNVCMDKIDRRYELQCWQLLLTGIVTLVNGDNLSYGRKAGSLKDIGGGSYWNVSPTVVDPWDTLERGATWCNETGKMSGNTLNVIFGKDAWTAYAKTTSVKDRNLQLHNVLDSLQKAQRDAIGKTYIGSTTVGAFNFNFFAYTDFYENDAGTSQTPYMDPKKVVILPETLMGTLTYTAVPQLLEPGQQPKKGKFHVWEATSEFKDARYLGVKSAGVPILAAVDQVYTEKVISG